MARVTALALAALLVLAFAGIAGAAPKSGSSGSSTSSGGSTSSGSGSSTTSGTTTTSTTSTTYRAFITTSLDKQTSLYPKKLFNVIVKGSRGVSTSQVVADENSELTANPAAGATVKKQYDVINGTASTLSGKQIQNLLRKTRIASITEDVRMRSTASSRTEVTTLFSNAQLWPDVAQASSFYNSTSPTPTIAIVDSGIDATRAYDFGARVLADVSTVSTGTADTRPGDGYGHGTFVASIAAGAADYYAGAAPTANLVSIDALDDSGQGLTSDVIDAANWIFRNTDKYGIRVANFSLVSGNNSSFMYDPLDKAIEKLWLNGVVVVTAAGNYATGGMASGVPYAPANEPFVITVGAADINGSLGTADDFNAPWSAYGYTNDGFSKPELGAPGRYMNGATPLTSAMYTQHPERIVAPGYLWMSGTSFAAPVVSGIVSDLLAYHPDWTPDQVKGALMLSAAPTGPLTGSWALGVGEVQAYAAYGVTSPPNPNAGLDQYLYTEPNGTVAFDSEAWKSAALANASWNSASWNSASWNSASWNSASWNSASWNSASWNSASWNSGTTQDTTLPSTTFSNLSDVG